jgi:hypothetical protein
LADTAEELLTLDEVKANKTEVNALATSKAEQTSLDATNNAVSAKAEKVYVDTLVASLASGSPKGTYATVSALQAAFPTGNTNTYVVTADGKWYYWNGSGWTAGTVYQSTGVADNSVGVAALKTMKWAEILGNAKLNFNTTTKTASLPSTYVYNDDGTVLANASSITYDDSVVSYICVDRTTKNLFVKPIVEGTLTYAYVLASVISGKVSCPFGFQNITVNGAAIKSANAIFDIPDNFVGIGKLLTKKWAEIIDGATKLSINTTNKTAAFTNNVYVSNDDGFVLAKTGSITYNDTQATYICVDRSTGDLFSQTIFASTTGYAFVLCRIIGGKVYSPFGYKQIMVDGLKPTGANADFELPDKSISADKLNFTVTRKRLYTLADACSAWKKGEKFPVAFLGDSTTESTTNPTSANTIGTDHTPADAYCTLLQELIRAETGSTVARIYNAGFGGKDATWALANINGIIKTNTHYADVKMIGIRHGLNDPMENSSTAEYIGSFRAAMRGIIEWCFENNIQPFLVTPQATMIAYPMYSPGYTSAETTSISLSVIRELAEEYNLELVDNYTYTKMLQLKVDNIQSLVPDGLHYRQEGHIYQAEFLFSEFNKETIKVTEPCKIGFNNPEVRSEIGNCAKLTARTGGYNSSLTTAAAGKVFKVNLYNHFKYGVTLDFTFTSAGDVTARINGVDYTLNTANHTVSISGMGLIKIEIINTAGNNLTFFGVGVA